MKLIERIREWNYNRKIRKMSSEEYGDFFTDIIAHSFKDKDIYKEQLKAIKPSFLKELATNCNTTVDEIKKLLKEGKLSIYTDSFLKKVEKYKVKK